MNTLETFFNSKTYNQMHPKKKAVIKELISNIDGKKAADCIPFLVKANTELKRMNMSFSSEESAQVFLLLTADMPPEKREKLNSILKMMP